ncbi:hypothetical protein V8D89_014520 [Ganoderma adspersum]
MSSMHSIDLQSTVAKLNGRLQLLLPPLLCSQRSSWEQGILAQAILECHLFFEVSDATAPDPLKSAPRGLVSWLYALAHDALIRQAPDGRLAVLLNGDGKSDAGALDPACIGPTLYYLCSVERGRRVPRSEVLASSSSFPARRGPTTPSLQDGAEHMLRYILEACPRSPVPQGSESPDLGTGQDRPWDRHLLSHRIDAVEIWSDSVYMLPPFLVSAAAFYTREPNCLAPTLTSTEGSWRCTAYELLRMGLQQVVLTAQVLQAPAGEWSHIFDLHAREFKRKAFWGVGNGWVCCGIVRVLSTALDLNLDGGLAEDERKEIVALLRRVYDILLSTFRACLTHMLPSHLFRDVLDDPASFEETNLSQMLSYTLYRLLDLHRYSPAFRAMEFTAPEDGEPERWEELAEAMRRAAEAKTDEWGFVRDVCGSPRFDAPGTAAEGQAWAIMMEVARAQYLSHKQTAA